MIEEKIDRDDLIIYEIIRHPVLCAEFLENVDRQEWEDVWELSSYQKEYICDFSSYVSIACGRSVGKCLDKDAKILNTDTGEYLSVKSWFNKELTIPTLDQNTFKQKIARPNITKNGIQNTIIINLSKGFKTQVTLEHPFLTPNGWTEAQHLKPGMFVAIPNKLNYFGKLEIDEDDLKYLAHFIAEGTYKTGSISTTELEVINEIHTFADKYSMNVRKEKCTYLFTGKHRLRLLEKYNLRLCHSYDKYIPQELFKLTQHQMIILLSRLFSDDGWCTKNEVGYSTASEQLARDIQHLLLRFGIVTSLSCKKTNCRDAWAISIKGHENIRNFCTIGFMIQRKQDKLEKLNKTVSRHNPCNIIPLKNFRKYHVKAYQKNRNSTVRPLKYNPTKPKAETIIDKDFELNRLLDADIWWLKVHSTTDGGLRETYSIEVPETGTLVADNIYSHNTVAIVHLLVWYLINKIFPNDYLVYTVPNKVHLDPVFMGLTRQFRSNSILMNYVDKRGGINASDHNIKLKNLTMLDCRIAGTSGGGASVVGMHSPFEILDESGFYPWGTWIELQPTLNTFQKGFRQFVSGVPTGLREKNVCYYADELDPKFSVHRTTAHENPRYSEADEKRNLHQFGGKDSEEYIHLVLGRHGTPTFAVFDRTLMEFKEYPVYKSKIDGLKMTNVKDILARLALIPPMDFQYDFTVCGIDLGYTEPTAIHVLYSRNGILKYHTRVQLTKVKYPDQKKIIDYLDEKFGRFDIIGIDAGGPGKPVVQDFLEGDAYVHKDYKKRMIPIEFGANIHLGEDSDGNEIKTKLRPFAFSVLQEYSNSHKIVYSSTDMDLVTELERTTYTKNPKGDIIYKTLTPGGGQRGADHHTSALLCAAISHWQVKDAELHRPKRKKLLGAKWLRR